MSHIRFHLHHLGSRRRGVDSDLMCLLCKQNYTKMCRLRVQALDGLREKGKWREKGTAEAEGRLSTWLDSPMA